jgi:Icc-related predicted phosphoesterase
LGEISSNSAYLSQLLRILFGTDLHGSEPAFRKLVNAAVKYDADVLMLGGDLTGKAIVPIIAVDGHHEADLSGRTVVVSTSAELVELEQTIRLGGQYVFRSTPDEVEALRSDPAKVEQLFHAAQRESLQSWFDLAAERLGPRDVRAFVIAGNDDPFEIDDVLLGHPFVTSVDHRTTEIADGISVLGLGGSTPTPWNTPREYADDDVGARVRELAEQLPDPRASIWNIHVPPFGTGLDFAPEVGADLTMKVEAGQQRLIPVGSRAIRDAIVAYQPLVGLHGHVHESRGFAKLGSTVVVNPGSEYSEGVLRAAFVVVKRGKARVQFLSA